MWISKEKWDALNKRVDSLEKKVPGTDYSEPLNFTVYDLATLRNYQSAGIWGYGNVPQQNVSVKEAINKIMSHIGIELTYVAGTPAQVVTQKTKALGK